MNKLKSDIICLQINCMFEYIKLHENSFLVYKKDNKTQNIFLIFDLHYFKRFHISIHSLYISPMYVCKYIYMY